MVESSTYDGKLFCSLRGSFFTSDFFIGDVRGIVKAHDARSIGAHTVKCQAMNMLVYIESRTESLRISDRSMKRIFLTAPIACVYAFLRTQNVPVIFGGFSGKVTSETEEIYVPLLSKF